VCTPTSGFCTTQPLYLLSWTLLINDQILNLPPWFINIKTFLHSLLSSYLPHHTLQSRFLLCVVLFISFTKVPSLSTSFLCSNLKCRQFNHHSLIWLYMFRFNLKFNRYLTTSLLLLCYMYRTTKTATPFHLTLKNYLLQGCVLWAYKIIMKPICMSL